MSIHIKCICRESIFGKSNKQNEAQALKQLFDDQVALDVKQFFLQGFCSIRRYAVRVYEHDETKERDADPAEPDDVELMVEISQE